MSRKWIYSAGAAGIATLAASLALTWDTALSSTGKPAPRPGAEMAERIAAPGRVEPATEEIKIASEVDGKLRRVAVDEGDSVAAGQVLAELVNDEYHARVASAEALLALRQAELRRVINGARGQERREAWARVKEAEAEMENARLEMQRREKGFQQEVFSREEFDRATRSFGVAKARYEAASENHKLVDDDPREEDRSRAEAEVALAEAQLAEARARREKTIIRSPIRGTILQKHLNAGESVSDLRETPIVTLGDSSTLRVRVDVDEADVSRLRIGQKSYVTAHAYAGHKFWGRVVRIGQLLGRKNIRTDEPAERVDAKILETLIELEPGQRLPAGLRVDAFIIVKD